MRSAVRVRLASVLWELRGEPLTFRVLQAACEMSPSSLNTRVKELRATQIVDHSDAGYHLTSHGRSLVTALEPLQAWADDWVRETGG